METFNFTFHALGTDQEDALRILNEGWLAHTAEYMGADKRMDLQSEWGVSFTELEVGHAARDGVVIFQEGA